MANEITSIKIGNNTYNIDFSQHSHNYLPLSGGTITGNLTMMVSNQHNTDQYIFFKYSNTDLDSYSWRIGYKGTGTGNDNRLIIQSNGSGAWTDVLTFGLTDHIAYFSKTPKVGTTNVSLEGHTHDGRYYTETEVNNLLAGKANSSHGNHVPTIQTASNKIFLRNDNTWATVTPANIGAATSSHGHENINIPSSNKSGEDKPSTYDAGLSVDKVYDGTSTGWPYSYGNALTIKGSGTTQLMMSWNSGQTSTNPNVSQSIYIRSQCDSAGDNWSKWTTILTDANIGTYAALPNHTHKFNWNNNDTNLEAILGNLQTQITANANAIQNKSDIHEHNYISSTTTRAKNTVLAGPTTGSNAAPTFRALVAADIPDLSASYISSTTSRTKNYVLAAPTSANGTPTFRALVAADIPSLAASKITSGIFAIGRIPTGTTSSTVALGNHTHSQYATVEQLNESELATAEALNDLDTRVDELESNGGGVNNVLNTVSKAFLIGTITTPTSTETQITTTISDTGVYLTASAGGLQATTIYASSGFFQETYSSSDERLKTFTEDIIINFEKLKSIRKKYFYWNDNNSDLQLGVSAQDIKEIYPEIVTENPETKYLSVDYSKLSVIGLAAIDKLHEENVQLKEENEKLKEESEQLKTRLDNLETILKEKGIL